MLLSAAGAIIDSEINRAYVDSGKTLLHRLSDYTKEQELRKYASFSPEKGWIDSRDRKLSFKELQTLNAPERSILDAIMNTPRPSILLPDDHSVIDTVPPENMIELSPVSQNIQSQASQVTARNADLKFDQHKNTSVPPNVIVNAPTTNNTETGNRERGGISSGLSTISSMNDGFMQFPRWRRQYG